MAHIKCGEKISTFAQGTSIKEAKKRLRQEFHLSGGVVKAEKGKHLVTCVDDEMLECGKNYHFVGGEETGVYFLYIYRDLFLGFLGCCPLFLCLIPCSNLIVFADVVVQLLFNC